ncbi:hypothetical protein RCL_jg12768.t2 [Rhizophagus clarus]|uniref:Uncharacterized protein n=1 Tax=Rhizophagus clarus TaxID=94130 RepID=A0A8H3KYX8_9GLOM|nr:hypothetical protein RCL_jg12768.t2 [Rhizophagus clarus]
MEVQKKQKTEKSSHLEDCKHYPRHQPPPNEMVKRIAQNLDNMDFIVKHLDGRVMINDERFLLSNQD